jgi:hypothetical protein
MYLNHPETQQFITAIIDQALQAAVATLKKSSGGKSLSKMDGFDGKIMGKSWQNVWLNFYEFGCNT